MMKSDPKEELEEQEGDLTHVSQDEEALESHPTPTPLRRCRLYRREIIFLSILALIAIVTAVAVTLTANNDDPAQQQVSGSIVDVHERRIYPGTVVIKDNLIKEIRPDKVAKADQFILPGFVDAHVHIESSLLVPSEFARLAVRHGTVATLSDPHEISNVLGLEGIRFMLDNADQVPLKMYFGAPCCVPATPFETAGAKLDVENVETLFTDPRIKFLSEMMNYPGVLADDPNLLAMIDAAQATGRVVDGHAPGLRGEDLIDYIDHGITTDHETFGLDEAREKIDNGMMVIIRSGSAAKNFAALHPIIGENPDMVMFCTDDAHPDLLSKQEVDFHVREAVALGYDLFDVLRIASVNPVAHYSLPVGLVRPGDPADFVIVDNLEDFTVLETWIDGVKVADHGETLFGGVPVPLMNNFHAQPLVVEDIARNDTGLVHVIVAEDGAIITGHAILSPTDEDVLKLVVVNRYYDDPRPIELGLGPRQGLLAPANKGPAPAVAYVKGFGLRTGALASSVAHDSHNIIAVGVNDEDLLDAINLIIDSEGGLVVAANGTVEALVLPVAGLMTPVDADVTTELYTELDQRAKNELGTNLSAPLMTLSFLALLVIPELKLSDLGLFDSVNFRFINVAVE